MKKFLFLVLIVVSVVSILSGCGAKSTAAFKDGTYEQKSEPDKYGNYSDLKITLQDGKITNVDWKECDKTGKEKGEEYGKDSGKDNYEKAQNALKGSKQYPAKLMETQDITKVDAISGATLSHQRFVDTVQKALDSAKN